jgi:hypothetical protein
VLYLSTYAKFHTLSFNDSFVMALGFEPGISRIRSRSIKHSTMTFGPKDISNTYSICHTFIFHGVEDTIICAISRLFINLTKFDF